jgi:LPXTG-site transpeptidase (sortase) family protein
MNIPRSLKRSLTWAIPLVLIIVGALYLMFAQETQQNTALAMPTTPQNASSTPQSVKIPEHISIPALHLSLNVSVGTFDHKTGQWAINMADAFFAQGTATPLIYGHNRDAVFAPLAHIAKGDVLELGYEDGSMARFSYIGTRFIASDDASVLTEKDPQTIILLTCSGFFDNQRRLVYFEGTNS